MLASLSPEDPLSPVVGTFDGADAVAPDATEEVPPSRAEALGELSRLRAENEDARREIAALRESVEARDEFIAIAGHELRNAMAGVLVAATNLHFRAIRSENLPAWIPQRLEVIGRQARSFVRRATTLLDVSRVTSDGVRLSLARVTAADICEAVRGELGPEAEVANCELQIDSGDGIAGLWDRDALEQIIINLVSNAIKYGAGRPVQLTISADSENVAFRVRDHGMGISDGDRERIFGRFERAVRSGEKSGFGMGLWIARQLAQAHGGEIQVESTPGEGTIFTALLPGVIDEPHR